MKPPQPPKPPRPPKPPASYHPPVRAFAVAAVLLLLFALSACDLIVGNAGAYAALERMREAGTITKEQFDALSGALTRGSWVEFGKWLAAVGAAWLGITPITNLARGKVTARKGTPPPAKATP